MTQGGIGWFGAYSNVLHVLRTLDADTDEQERFAVRGSINNLLGLSSPDTDCAVGPSAQFRSHPKQSHIGPFETDCPNCVWSGLANALNGTSYGLRNVTVIG